MECTLKSLPPGSMLTVSSDLVDDLMVKLVLRLQPLNGEGYRPLNQQTLLTTTLKVGLVTVVLQLLLGLLLLLQLLLLLLLLQLLLLLLQLLLLQLLLPLSTTTTSTIYIVC